MVYISRKIIFVFRFELSTRFIKRTKINFLVHWWCVYYNQPTSTPLNQWFWKSVRSSRSGEPWWSTTMTLVMVSLFDQFVPFSSFEWKAKIWIGSHLILQYYFSRKGLISQQPMRIQDFLELWLGDENSNSMLKNRICPGNKPRLFWVTFKLMIFQKYMFYKNLV